MNHQTSFSDPTMTRYVHRNCSEDIFDLIMFYHVQSFERPPSISAQRRDQYENRARLQSLDTAGGPSRPPPHVHSHTRQMPGGNLEPEPEGSYLHPKAVYFQEQWESAQRTSAWTRDHPPPPPLDAPYHFSPGTPHHDYSPISEQDNPFGAQSRRNTPHNSIAQVCDHFDMLELGEV